VVQHAALPVTAFAEAGALNRRAAFASIAVALLLVGLKLWAAWRTGSTAMLGSLADTALDLVASLTTLAGVWVASQPADREHRFGHGKAEAVAAMVQVVLIALSAAGIALQAVLDLLDGGRTAEAESGIAVSLAAIALTLALLAYQRHVLRRTGSMAIRTDHLHYQSDLVLNLAVIAALALDRWGGLAGADPLFGLAIAAWLGVGAWRAAQGAVEQLMDREWPRERRQRFLAVVAQHPQLRGVHDLRTRTSGTHDFAQFHAAVDGRMTVAEAHRVMDEIEAQLEREFPGVEVLIHPDPEGLIDEQGQAAEELLPRRRRARRDFTRQGGGAHG
jgi:ferrous-iron efflux pump FieF